MDSGACVFIGGIIFFFLCAVCARAGFFTGTLRCFDLKAQTIGVNLAIISSGPGGLGGKNEALL